MEGNMVRQHFALVVSRKDLFEYFDIGHNDHMMAEGMVQESMVLTRSIHDRYHAFKRNPFNEIECSDHYGRAMASYGTFISACGFTYHGPHGHIGFSPKLDPDNFKAPFTAAEGWGTFSQQRTGNSFSAQLKVNYGKLNVKEFFVDLDKNQKASRVTAMLDNSTVSCTFVQTDGKCAITMDNMQLIGAGQSLSVQVS